MDLYRKFVNSLYLNIEEGAIEKLNEYTFLIFLHKYCTDKKEYKYYLKNFDKIKKFNSEQYFKTVFNPKIKGKATKAYDGVRLEMVSKLITDSITNTIKNESTQIE
jgi:hypothetical protein